MDMVMLGPGQAPTYHQIFQCLFHVPQDLNFTLVGQFGGWEAAWLLLLLLNDLQALAGWSIPGLAGLRGLWPPRAQVPTLLLWFPFHANTSLPPHFCFCHYPHLKSSPRQPYISRNHSRALKLKPCLLQEVFLNSTFSHKSVLPLTILPPTPTPILGKVWYD